MRHKRAVSLRFSLSTAMTAMVLVTTLIMGTAAFVNARSRMREDLNVKIQLLATSIAAGISAREHSELSDPAQMEGEVYREIKRRFLRIIDQEPRIGYIYSFRRLTNGDLVFVLDSGEEADDQSPIGMVYDEDFPTLTRAFEPPYQAHVDPEITEDEYGTWLSAYAPILWPDGSLEGVLGVDMIASDIIAQERQLLLVMGLITLGVSLLGIAGGARLSRRIVEPLSTLADDMGQIRNLQLNETRLGTSNIVEVQTMETALSNMKKGLRSFKRYVPSDVVAQLMNRETEARLGTEIHSITSFFSDLENFTTVSEKLGPDLVTKLLGPYLQMLTEHLQSRGATVDKFIGDAVVAFWGAPHPVPDHPFIACTAALDANEMLSMLNKSWSELDIPPLSTRIGMNTGDALVGNIGFEERLSYTALGDTMNLAARLESLNKLYGTRILVGESTFRAVTPRIAGRFVDKVAVKGKTVGTELYEIFRETDLPREWDRFLSAYTPALEFYRAGDFAKAVTGFERALSILPGDGPVKVLLGRSRRYLANPPEPLSGWSGVTVLQDK